MERNYPSERTGADFGLGLGLGLGLRFGLALLGLWLWLWLGFRLRLGLLKLGFRSARACICKQNTHNSL